MKKNLKKYIISLTILLVSFICCFTNVNAEGIVDITYVGSNSVVVNDEITLYLQVQNIEGYENGIVALGGNIIFDENYLELISATPTTTPYQYNINTSYNYKLFGLSFTTNGFKEDTTIITLVFKAKKIGSTEITFTNYEVCDSFFKYSANIIPKTLIINDIVDTDTTTTTKKDSNTTKTTTTTQTTEIIEEKTTTKSGTIEDNNTNNVIKVSNNSSSDGFIKKYLNFNYIKNNIKKFTNNLYNKICNIFG